MATLKSKLLLIIFILPLLLMAVEENEEKAADLMREMMNNYDRIETFQADFTQKNSWAAMDKKIESSGKMYYDSENLILKYSKPNAQEMKITKDKIYIFDPGMNKLMISKNTNIQLKPVELLRQYWDISTIYITESDEGFLVKLEYSGGRVEAFIEDYYVQDVVLYDLQGNSVSYQFRNMKLNETLPENIFEMNIDDSVEVIDLTK